MRAVQDYGAGKLKLSLTEKYKTLAPYIRSRLMDQVKSVWFIIAYLVLFQLIVLRLPIVHASMISVGVGIVILGLAFFMEGLNLGLMPFGEIIGATLPRKSKLYTILAFGFFLGIGATFAEPAIQVLKAAGSNVAQKDAPLLHGLLNDFSGQLVASVGVGVGIAVIFGLLRFLYGWSLKVLIVPLVVLLSGATIVAHLTDALNPIIGLAWDCGAVTTGPVTVPLVLALGIGVCRVVNSEDSKSAGFGIVTLASLFPILAVLSLGITHYYLDDYYGRPNFKGTVVEAEVKVERVGTHHILRGFSKDEISGFMETGEVPEGAIVKYEGGSRFERDGRIHITGATVILAKEETSTVITDNMKSWDPEGNIFVQMKEAAIAAVQAIIPLCIFLFLVIKLILRERVPQADEIFLGILLAAFGMALFGLGITLGLTPLGGQLGANVPSAFAVIAPWGLEGYQGPLYGAGLSGKLVAVAFAFFLGFGATLAEPALNALGSAVEKITVGAFKKPLLMQSVAIGVALGIGTGVLKIAYDIPLAYLLLPPYAALLILTLVSDEEFVNIGWDSAGVTTGPITVPLVLAMGLGVGGQVPDVIEGFGVLSLASVGPILSVLTVGLLVRKSRAPATEAAAEEPGTGG